MLAPRSRSSATSSCPLSATTLIPRDFLWVSDSPSLKQQADSTEVFCARWASTVTGAGFWFCTNLYHRQAWKHCDRYCCLPEHWHRTLLLSKLGQRDGDRASRQPVVSSARSIPLGGGWRPPASALGCHEQKGLAHPCQIPDPRSQLYPCPFRLIVLVFCWEKGRIPFSIRHWRNQPHLFTLGCRIRVSVPVLLEKTCPWTKIEELKIGLLCIHSDLAQYASPAGSIQVRFAWSSVVQGVE